ncbi:hypothetical protein BH09ACT12_BH09ACT12_15980 [soil metagenome]
MEPWLWAMEDADDAESRGDAAGAWAAIRRRPLTPGGDPFWRPSRVHCLQQLVLLGELTPGWAVSRWILAQALQHLSERERGRGESSRSARAVRIASELRGTALALPLTAAAGSEADEWANVMDHDWVYRQVVLFELGGLDDFLTHSASADLVSRAERIGEWALAPMGGYTFVDSFGEHSLWLDQADQGVITTPNIGSAVRLAPGCAVIGRLVPTGDDRMFESAPLAVTGKLAREIALDPPRWLDLLRDSQLVRDGVVRTDTLSYTGLLSDVPLEVTEMVLSYRPALHRLVELADASEVVAATLSLAGEVVQADDPCPRCYDEPDDDCPECFDDGWDAVGHLHAALLEPVVLEALPELITDDDELLLREVHDVLAEPARSWVGSVLDAREAAA